MLHVAGKDQGVNIRHSGSKNLFSPYPCVEVKESINHQTSIEVRALKAKLLTSLPGEKQHTDQRIWDSNF